MRHLALSLVEDVSFRMHPCRCPTHVKISQLVNTTCSQQACGKLANKLQQCCYFINLLQGCHSQLVDKLLNCRAIRSYWNNS